jgi:hypothetical protein
VPVLTSSPEPPDAADSVRIERDLWRDAGATLGIVGLVVVAVSFSFCRGARPDDADERCARILDKYVELRQRAADPKAPLHVVEEKQEDARKLAIRDGALVRCTRAISVDSAACADKAQSADELERCFP